MAKRGSIVVRTSEAEKSFVLKPGEGLNNPNLIKHTILNGDQSPRASSVHTPRDTTTSKPPAKYVSPMARARQEKKRRDGMDSTGTSKDCQWPNLSDLESMSSNTASSESGRSRGTSNGGTPEKPIIPSSGYIIPASGCIIPASGSIIPSSGYIPKSRGLVSTVDEDEGARLPKFGVWDNNNENSGPCYTLLFQNASQEKKVGGPIRVHNPQPCVPSRDGDLYSYHSGLAKSRKKTQSSFLCCFPVR